MPKSFDEVKALKENWRGDPIWDIENTEGFEDRWLELKCFRLTMESNWTNQNEERLQKRAAELECSIKLVEYIEILEYRFQVEADRLDRLELAYT